ncbi:MAG: response regulator [Bacillota bacterium]
MSANFPACLTLRDYTGVESARRTVLVVEDSTTTREVVVKILRREGYNAIGAADGDEAWALLRHAMPDLVLLDVMMPGMDGMTLLTKLREQPTLRELPVIMLTALSDDGRMDSAKRLGATAYLVKTRFSYDELLEQVAKVVRH